VTGPFVARVRVGGQEVRGCLADLPPGLLRRCEPVRSPGVYQRQRHMPGRWFSTTTGGFLEYESLLERDWMLLLDFDREVEWFCEQPLRPVQIREQRIEHARALHDTFLDLAPFILRDDEGQWIKCPRPVGALRIGVDVVGDAVLDDQTPREFERAARAIVRLIGGQTFNERSPVRTHGALCIEKFIVAARIRGVACKTRLGPGLRRHRALVTHGFALHVRRKSSVQGKSGLTIAGTSGCSPGVWPMRKKRAKRRLSDSKAFTGNVV